MAILPAHPNISVTITSNNTPLPEYPDPTPFTHPTFTAPPDSISGVYIECTSDSEFQLNYEVKPGFELEARHNEVSFWADVNGQCIGGCWAGNGTIRGGWRKVFSEAITRAQGGDMVYQSLRFRRLERCELILLVSLGCQKVSF